MFYHFEYPKVYSSNKSNLEILNRPVKWFKPYYTSLGQMLLYRLKIKPLETKFANTLLTKRIIKMNDGSEIMIGMTTPKTPVAVVVYLHTVSGNYTQLSHIAHMTSDDNIAYLSYTRSGNDPLLMFSTFNFVGRMDELDVVLSYIKQIYPNVPIHAIGASAGSNLLMRYIGSRNQNKVIKSAVLLSPGYNFIEAMNHMNGITKAYLVNKLKYTLRNITGPHKDALNEVKTLDDWILYQSKLLGYDSSEAFIQDCNPINFVHAINIPTLCISSFDDNVFLGSLTKKYLYLPNINPHITIVTTNLGGHVIFEDSGGIFPWCLRVSYDWIKEHL